MKTFTVEVTQVVIVTQADRASADKAFDIAFRGDTDGIEEAMAELFAANRAEHADDLTAAAQLEHSGLISREKYNHICENIRARESIRGAMA